MSDLIRAFVYANTCDRRVFVRKLELPFVPVAGMRLKGLFHKQDEGIKIDSVTWDLKGGVFEVRLKAVIDEMDMGSGIHPDWKDCDTNAFPVGTKKQRR